MKRVPQCTTGRVFLLKFRDSTTRRFFYWLQEPKEDKDEDLLKKVRPSPPSSQRWLLFIIVFSTVILKALMKGYCSIHTTVSSIINKTK